MIAKREQRGKWSERKSGSSHLFVTPNDGNTSAANDSQSDSRKKRKAIRKQKIKINTPPKKGGKVESDDGEVISCSRFWLEGQSLPLHCLEVAVGLLISGGTGGEPRGVLKIHVM